MTDAPTLLPCPFCRGEAKQGVHDLHEPGIPMAYYVHCMGCFARSGCFDTIAEAIAAWNRRTAPPAAADLTIEERIAAAMANQACTDDLAMVNRSSMDCPVGCPIHSPAAADEVERVARAISDDAAYGDWDKYPPAWRNTWRKYASAAIAAMRKPAGAATTEETLAAMSERHASEAERREYGMLVERDAARAEAAKLREALETLVIAKDIKDRCEKLPRWPASESARYAELRDRGWMLARAALAACRAVS